MEIHASLKEKLIKMVDKKKIPHIIFHGPLGSGKRHLLYFFINRIYDHQYDKIKRYVMYVDCAHGKGIRFIRDQLKFFAKTNIQNKSGLFFKSIVLLNAEKLTTDAQSALRRCIEQFSHTTRFFIIVENQNKLLRPILSRFCNIHIPLPIINEKLISLHTLKKNYLQSHNQKFIAKRHNWLKTNIHQKGSFFSTNEILEQVTKSSLDVKYFKNYINSRYL